MKVTTVNHGDVFNHGSDWFTFHCPECNKQLNPQQDKCKCGCVIEWKNKEQKDVTVQS